MKTIQERLSRTSNLFFVLIASLLITIPVLGQKTRTMYDKNGRVVLKYSFVNDVSTDCSVPDKIKRIFPQETIFYSNLFSSACAEHDYGWSHAPWQKAGYSGLQGKKIADERFLANMRSACNKRFTSALDAPRKAACYSAAEIWYSAVANKIDEGWQEKQTDFTKDDTKVVLYSPKLPPMGAALYYGNYRNGEKSYLFRGGSYNRYDKVRKVSEGPSAMSNWKLPSSWKNLDASVYYGKYRGSEMVYLFKGNQYYSYNKSTDKLAGPYALQSNWKLPASWNRLDAALYYGNYRGSEMVYLFRGNQYYSYNKTTDKAAGPYDLHANWKVPRHWKKIDAALYYGKYSGGEMVYLFNGSEYCRYNKTTDKISGPYPINRDWY